MMDARAHASFDRPHASRSAVDRGALIDVRQIGRIIRRRIWLIVALCVVMLAAALVAFFLAEPRYTATARVALERGSEEVVKVDQVTPPVVPDSASVDTEVQVLRSPKLAGQVVDALNLTRDPEFNPPLEEGVAVPPEQARRRAIAILLGHLKVEREGFSYAIQIDYEARSPGTAARVANAIADQYVGAQVTTKSDATVKASRFLERKLDQLRVQVQSAEAAVARYRADHQLFAATNDSTVAQEELGGLNTQLAEARAQQAEAEARLATAKAQLARGSTGEDLGEALDSPVVSQLRAQRAETSRQVAALRQRYGPRHPELQQAEKSLADIDSQIQAEVTRIISNVTAQANAARQRTGSLQASVNRTQGTMAANNEASVRLNELMRKADSARVLYQTFLDRYKETLAQHGLERSDSYIVAKAGVPTFPSSPNLLVYLVLGLVAGLAAAATAVAVLQLLERGIETSEGVEKELGVPSLGSIPDVRSLPEYRKRKGAPDPVQLVIERPQSAFAEAFRRLRTSIHYARPGEGGQVIAVTSALPGEGKTTSAICLVRSAALAGVNTVLVDCDLRRRASSRKLAQEASAGLSRVLAGKATLDEALLLDPETGAHILPQREGESDPILSLDDSTAFAALLATLRQRFDLIVLDTPPVLPVDDSRVISAQADGVVMLMRWRKTAAKATELALRQLDEVGADVIGASLTQVDLVAQGRSGYGDVGYYYSAYKSYYA